MPAPADAFGDDQGSTHEASINLIADAGITVGCTADSYCPGEPISRAQMASLLVRALAWNDAS